MSDPVTLDTDAPARSSSESDLPRPASTEPEAMSEASALRRPHVLAPATQDPEVRAQRRRATFAHLLEGDPEPLPQSPLTPLARLLRLAVIDHSPAEAITVLYREVLGRDPDGEGLALWSSRVEGGENLLALATELASSPEALRCAPDQQAQVRSDLLAWESLLALTELGTAAWRPSRIYTPGRVWEEIFVEALFEVTLQRRPTSAELDMETTKLASGSGREWLLRAYAARPEARARLLGTPTTLRARLRQWRTSRQHVETVRGLVAIAEARQVTQFLATLSAPGWGPPDFVRVPENSTEVR